MRIGNEPAYPAKYTKHKTGEVGNQVPIMADGAGLTKRELIAAMAMQSLIATGTTIQVHTKDGALTLPTRVGAPKIAVEYADALLAELSKEAQK